MKRPMTPLRETVVAMIELIASQRPDLLSIYLDLASNSPARYAVLELVEDFNVRETKDLHQAVIKAVADLDRLERRRGGWRHPEQVVSSPNVGGLLYLCRARIHSAMATGRRRRLEVLARKLQRAHDREKTHAWITDFIGISGQGGEPASA